MKRKFLTLKSVLPSLLLSGLIGGIFGGFLLSILFSIGYFLDKSPIKIFPFTTIVLCFCVCFLFGVFGFLQTSYGERAFYLIVFAPLGFLVVMIIPLFKAFILNSNDLKPSPLEIIIPIVLSVLVGIFYIIEPIDS
jgi:hypothetical protein